MSFTESRTEDYPYLQWNEHLPFIEGLDSQSDSFLSELEARAMERPLPNSFCYVYDKDAKRVLYTDKHLQELLGVSSEEFIRGSDYRKQAFFHPDDRTYFADTVFPAYATLQNGLQPKERQLFRSVFACRFRNSDDPNRFDSYRILNVALHLNDRKYVACDFGLVVRIDHELPNAQFAYCISPEKNPPICHLLQPTSMFFPNVQPKLLSLSDREREILQLLSQGLSSREISKKLFISSHTVDTHRRNMIKKTGVRNTVELVHLYRGSQ